MGWIHYFRFDFQNIIGHPFWLIIVKGSLGEHTEIVSRWNLGTLKRPQEKNWSTKSYHAKREINLFRSQSPYASQNQMIAVHTWCNLRIAWGQISSNRTSEYFEKISLLTSDLDDGPENLSECRIWFSRAEGKRKMNKIKAIFNGWQKKILNIIQMYLIISYL